MFKFESDDVSNLKAVINYGEGLSKTKEVTSFETATYVNKDGVRCPCMSIEFSELNAKELNDAIKVTLINTEDDTQSRTLTYSVDAYAFAKKAEGNGGVYDNLIDSLMKYIRAVDNFA